MLPDWSMNPPGKPPAAGNDHAAVKYAPPFVAAATCRTSPVPPATRNAPFGDPLVVIRHMYGWPPDPSVTRPPYQRSPDAVPEIPCGHTFEACLYNVISPLASAAR